MNFKKKVLEYNGNRPNNCDHCGITWACFVFWPVNMSALQEDDLLLGKDTCNSYRLCSSCDGMDGSHLRLGIH